MSTELDVVSALSLVGAALDQQVLDDLRAAGFPEVRRAHGYVVQRLLEGPRTATHMAVELGVTQQAVAKLAAEMVRLDLVAQVPDPEDARRRPLALTDRGEAVVAAARRSRARLADAIAEEVGVQDVERTLVVLRAAMRVLGMTEAVDARRVPPPMDV